MMRRTTRASAPTTRRELVTSVAICTAALATACVNNANALNVIADARRIDVGDAELYVEIRGRADAPMLIWLHGGPGGAERPLFRYFNGDLEETFLVVYLDQRGAGRSFDPHAPPARLTIAQHVADLGQVIDQLCAGYSKSRVILLGHSWGTVLGSFFSVDHPSKVSALICAAPLVSMQDAWRREYAFDVGEATRRDDEDVLRRLREIGAPPFASPAPMLALQQVTQRYGGVQHSPQNRLSIVATGVMRGLVTPWEIRRFIQGNQVSLAAMHSELSSLDMRVGVPRLDVPVFFFLGRHDHHLDSNLANEYFEALRAPRKQVFWFEDAAHDIPFDQPALFNMRVITIGEGVV